MTSSILGSEYVTDTMALVLRIEQRKMGMKARLLFQLADVGEIKIHIPALVFAEILYLSERKRIYATLQDVALLLETVPTYQQVPLTLDIIQSVSRIKDIPELHDRLIAGTALALNLPLITNDPVIQASSTGECIWL
jgi:predicted nucleic acid-binding protein